MEMNDDDFDDMIKRLMRIMGMDTPFPRQNSSPTTLKSNPIDKGDIYIGDDMIAITIDLAKYAKQEDINVKAIDNKHILIEVVNYDDIANVFSRELELSNYIEMDSIKSTYINGVLDITMKIDKNVKEEI